MPALRALHTAPRAAVNSGDAARGAPCPFAAQRRAMRCAPTRLPPQLIKGNTFAGTAFFSYGSFWISVSGGASGGAAHRFG